MAATYSHVQVEISLLWGYSVGKAAAAVGKMRREGDMNAFAKVPALGAAFAKLHDTLARRTA